MTPDKAIDTPKSFVTQVNHGPDDLEWGAPGDCESRVDNDPDIVEEMPYMENESFPVWRDRVAAVGLGRHYGDPQCIWCHQGS